MIAIEHLEIDLTQACQLSCVHCNHSVPMWRALKGGPWSTTSEIVEHDLAHLGKVLHARKWGALGGEPLMNAKITEILHVVRRSGIADQMEVWTNGLMLPRMKPEFWKAFDILVFSIYPDKHTDDSLDWIRNKCAIEGVELVEKDERHYPNWTQLLETVPTDPATTKEKFAKCFFRHFSRVVNYGYFFTCCCGPHMPMLLQGQPFGTDGIAVENITEEALLGYLRREEPLGACTICAGRNVPGAVAVPWREEKDPEKWKQLSAGVTDGPD